MLYSVLYRFISRHKRISKLRNRIIYSLWNGHKMSLWKSNFGSTYQNLPRYLKSLTFLFLWIAEAISMHQNVQSNSIGVLILYRRNSSRNLFREFKWFKYYVIMFLTFLWFLYDLQYCKSSKIAIFWPRPPTSLMT